MIKRLLEYNARTVCHHPWPVIAITILITIVMLFPALHLKGNFNILNLLPMNSPQVRNLNDLLDEFGGDDRLLIAAEPAEGGSLSDTRDFMEYLLMAIKNRDSQRDNPLFQGLGELSDDERDWLFQFLFDNGMFLLDEEGLAACQERFTTEGIQAIVQEDKVLIRSGSPVDRKRVKKDPLNLSRILLKAVPPRFRNIKQGYFRTAPDKSLILMELNPVKLPQDGDFALELIAFCEETITQASDAYEGPVPRITITGGYMLASSDTNRIMGVILKTFLASAVIVGAMLFFAFKEIRILFLILPGLGIAIIWVAGLARILFGEITVVSAAFAAILIGLGVDFAIHVYNRFRIELNAGKSPEDAMAVTHQETGLGVMMGALTTAAAFYILAVSDFKGVREFGILVGTGVLLSACIYFTGFSAYLYVMGRKGFKNTFTREFGLSWLVNRISAKPGLIVGFFILLTAGALVYVFTGEKLAFENDARNLRPKDDPVMVNSERIAQAMGLSLVRFPVMVSADSYEELLIRTRQVSQGLKQMQEEGVISDYLSPGDFLATIERQQANAAVLAAIDYKRVAEDLRIALKNNRFSPNAFSETFTWLEELQTRVARGDILDADDMSQPAVQKQTGMFLKVDPEKKIYKSLSVFYPPAGKERDFDTARIEKAIGADGKQVFVTGVNIISRVVIDKISHWMSWIFPVVLAVIMVILFLNFRSPRYALMAASPLFIGIALLLAAMKLLDVKFSVMNFGIIPMVIGIGVDNGIHIIRAYLDGHASHDGVRDSISICGRAVIMTSLTTIAGFGSLILGEYQGIISMGLVAGLGVAFCLIATIIFLPALMLLWGKRHNTTTN